MTTQNEILLASTIVHLFEFIGTGDAADLAAAKSNLSQAAPLLRTLRDAALLPLTRQPIDELDNILAGCPTDLRPAQCNHPWHNEANPFKACPACGDERAPKPTP